MIIISQEQTDTVKYTKFTLVCRDTATFTATPHMVIDGVRTPYEMQDGDKIVFNVSDKPKGTPMLSIVADEDKQIIIDSEASNSMTVGNYYADITLEYANGNKDTFIPIPMVGDRAISNFRVVYGV